jgi:hypothetical protein
MPDLGDLIALPIQQMEPSSFLFYMNKALDTIKGISYTWYNNYSALRVNVLEPFDQKQRYHELEPGTGLYGQLDLVIRDNRQELYLASVFGRDICIQLASRICTSFYAISTPSLLQMDSEMKCI